MTAHIGTFRISRRQQAILVAVLLVGLLAAAAALRLTNLNWDQFQHVHPDERFIVWVTDSMLVPVDLSTALDPLRSTINPFRWPPGAGDLGGKPRSYAYGHFPLYLLVIAASVGQAVGEWLGETSLAFPAFFQPLHTIGRHLAEYNYLALVGRALSTLCDLGTLLLVFGLGRRAYGPVAGLLAAAAYAFAVLPIQLSHFYAVDMVLTFCVVAAVALAARRAEGGGWLAWLGAGAFVGLAIGSKFSAILLGLPLIAAAWYRTRSSESGYVAKELEPPSLSGVLSWSKGLSKRRPSTGSGPVAGRLSKRRSLALLGHLAAAGIAAALVFVATNPFALIEFEAYVSNIVAQNAMVSGVMDAPYTRQYIGTVPYWYFIQQLSQWGLGWPLGTAAWGGFVWAVLRFGLRRAGRAETVMLAWALPYFALTGVFHAKFLRYMAPLLPFLLIFGAGAAVAAWRWLRARWGGRGQLAWAAGALVVAAVTVGWALAFAGVYRQEHPWIQASRWIYANIPDGSKLLTEHWDDALPLLMDEIPGERERRTYERVELPLYDPDTAAKLDRLAQELGSADYLILASNRLSAPISRLRARYPMTSNYYRLLWNGELGYSPVATFQAYPQLLGIVIPDDHADESFTVYDHPRAVIFANTGHLSEEQLRTRLGRFLPRTNVTTFARSHVRTFQRFNVPTFQRSNVHRAPGHARYLPPEQPADQPPAPDAPLTLSQPVDTLPVVADFRWNTLASQSPVVAVLLWWLALSVLGWAMWPLLFPALRGLGDRGYGLARTAGWLLVGWVHWMAVSLGLWQNRLAPLAIVCAALILAGLAAWWRQRRQIAAFWATRRRLLLSEEGLFALVFLAFVGIRLLNPDLWQPWNGGEKFMESAFLNAILRSAHFPPYDPYFAGGALNYYYYGFYLVGLLIKLTGIAPEVAFNLAVPLLFALTGLGVFSVGLSLTRTTDDGRWTADDGRRIEDDGRPTKDDGQPSAVGGRRSAVSGLRSAVSGLLAVVLALLMGNLDALDQFVARVRVALAGLQPPGFDYWAASRVIPETINEFPFWTFLFADLHPHLIAMPFGLLVIGLAVGWGLGVGGWGLGAGSTKLEAGSWKLEAGSERVRRWLRVSLSPSLPLSPSPILPFSPSPPLPLSLALLLALSLGALGAINTWDLPTYFLLVVGGLAVAAWRARRRGALVVALLAAIAIGGMAVAAYWPFYAHYQSQVGGHAGPLLARYLGWVREASPVLPWLTVWGILLFLAASAVAALLLGQRAGASVPVPGEVSTATENAELLDDSEPAPNVAAQADVVAPILGAAAQEDAVAAISDDSEPDAADVTVADDEAGEWAEAVMDAAPVPRPQVRGRAIGALALIALALVLVALDRPTAALMAIPMALALALAFRREAPAKDNLLALLLALGAGVVAGTELVYLRDFLEGGDWYRMNTLFKFSVPAWLLLGLACGVLMPRLWRELDRLPGWLRIPWRSAVVALLMAGLLFLPLGTQARVRDRFPGARPSLGTINGLDFMTVGKFNWPDGDHEIELVYDYLAINWLLDHVTGTPVIAETPAGGYTVDSQQVTADYYRAAGLRAASFTGFPTFVGQHQYEQRLGEQVGLRLRLGQEFFETTDIARARELMQELRVGYIYIGPLERIVFRPDSLRKFDAMLGAGDLALAYRNPQVTIYRVLGR